MTRLKAELAEVTRQKSELVKDKAGMSEAASAEKTHREEEVRVLKEEKTAAESRTNSLQSELDKANSDADKLLTQLSKLNMELKSKPLLLLCFLYFFDPYRHTDAD